MLHPAFNAGAQMVAWWACVLLADAGRPALGSLAMLAFVAAHLLLGGRADARLIAAAAVTGLFADSALVLSGAIAFPERTRLGPWSPLWMAALWAGFGAQLRHSLAWLVRSPVRAAVAGAIIGPLAYVGGEGLGVMEIGGPRASALAAIGVAWCIALAVLARAAWSRRETPS